MKKILVVFLLIVSVGVSYAEGRDNYAFLGNFFGKKQEQKKENPSSAIMQEEENKRDIPVFLEFKYIDEETKTEKTFQVQVEPVKEGDCRPPEIAALETAITNEKVREKVTPMIKYYESFFRTYLDEISSDPEKIYRLGNQYFINRKYERAKDIFSKNIDTPDNLFGAAVTNRFLGYDTAAIDYYSEVIYMNPNISEAYLGRGICYRNIGKYKEALGDFLKYKSMKNTEEAYTALGNIYILREEYEKAKKILKEGRILYPDSKLISDLMVKAYAK